MVAAAAAAAAAAASKPSHFIVFTCDWICSQAPPPKNALKSGVCIRHGAKITRRTCKFQGCTNKVQCAGVCFRHGARDFQKKPPASAQIVHIVVMHRQLPWYRMQKILQMVVLIK